VDLEAAIQDAEITSDPGDYFVGLDLGGVLDSESKDPETWTRNMNGQEPVSVRSYNEILSSSMSSLKQAVSLVAPSQEATRIFEEMFSSAMNTIQARVRTLQPDAVGLGSVRPDSRVKSNRRVRACYEGKKSKTRLKKVVLLVYFPFYSILFCTDTCRTSSLARHIQAL
jgi:hypothetical protein